MNRVQRGAWANRAPPRLGAGREALWNMPPACPPAAHQFQQRGQPALLVPRGRAPQCNSRKTPCLVPSSLKAEFAHSASGAQVRGVLGSAVRLLDPHATEHVLKSGNGVLLIDVLLEHVEMLQFAITRAVFMTQAMAANCGHMGRSALISMDNKAWEPCFDMNAGVVLLCSSCEDARMRMPESFKTSEGGNLFADALKLLYDACTRPAGRQEDGAHAPEATLLGLFTAKRALQEAQECMAQ